MLNPKNQNPNSDLSADEILANIRKKLGIVEENTNNSFQNQEEVYEFDYNEDDDLSLEDANTQESSNIDFIDDDFNFTEDFAKKPQNNNSDVNKAYRAYQNTMNSAYNNYHTENANTTVENKSQEDWTSSIIEDFDSFLTKEMKQETKVESKLQANLQNNDTSFEEFDIESHFNNAPATDEYLIKDAPQEQYQSYNNQMELPENTQNTQNNSTHSTLDVNLSMNFEQFIREQITAWCNKNLESVCYKIIKEELTKKN